MNPWTCLCCDCEIDADTGKSLDDSGELHVCVQCWVRMSPAQQLETIRKWRRTKLETEVLEAMLQVCRGAMDGWHLPGSLGESGRN